ncbi:MAG: DUF2125 domain-containing protein [Pseudomonadota bacterium]
MSEAASKPAYDSARRIKWLMFAVLLFVALYTGGWFFVASRVNEVVQTRLVELRAEGIEIDCPDQDVRGFPFRMGVFCSDFDVLAAAEGLVIDGGALRSAAQVYDPTRAVVEIDAPLQIDFSGETVRLDYSVGQAVVEARSPGRRGLSVEFTDGSGEADDFTTKWDRFTAFSREADGNLEVAFQGVGLQTDAADVPPLNVDADAIVMGASYETRSIRGKVGTLRRLALQLNEDRGLLASGPFAVSDDGLVNADLNIRVVDVPGIVNDLQATAPKVASAISGFLSLQSLGGDNGDEVEFAVTIRDGQAKIGIIPLGTLPVF